MNMNMYVYRVTEKQNSGSADTGEPFEAFNLSEAKRISTRRQKVKGSVLVLSDSGRIGCVRTHLLTLWLGKRPIPSPFSIRATMLTEQIFLTEVRTACNSALWWRWCMNRCKRAR